MALTEIAEKLDGATESTAPNGATAKLMILESGDDTPKSCFPDNLSVGKIKTGTPASAAASGVAGQIRWDSSFIYICVNTNTWKRVAIATW